MTNFLHSSRLLLKFQSTHLHEVWQYISRTKVAHVSVSIHTPTWGVTYSDFVDTFHIISFNPHTYMRCDAVEHLSKHICISFNPHTYMRCDSSLGIILSKIYSFNPHTYMRCDLSVRNLSSIIHLFQSTHLHEVWPQHRNQPYEDDFVSIHTPTWGVTDYQSESDDPTKVSIHTPTWGVTPAWRA